jgi:hypothetical protein
MLKHNGLVGTDARRRSPTISARSGRGFQPPPPLDEQLILELERGE